MVRLSDLSDGEREFLVDYECPEIELTTFTSGPPLAERRVAVVTTAGLRRPSDRPYAFDATDYRLLPSGERDDIVMDHISSDHDRTGFALDLNTVLPLDRLDELVQDGVIGGLSSLHYSFMGAGDVLRMQPAARQIAAAMKNDGVDTVLLSPV